MPEHPRFTGWDDDGGFAELAVAPEAYVYPLPASFDDVHAAPLLCAGIIGYRALLRAACPPGGRLGLWGFGASAHLTLQVARHEGARIHVFTRAAGRAGAGAPARCATARRASRDPTPEPLDSAILFAPVGDLVPWALAALDRGGTLAVAGVHLTDVPPLVYEDHLFEERTLTSVTANTRADGAALLALAEEVPLRPEVDDLLLRRRRHGARRPGRGPRGRDGGRLAQAVRRARAPPPAGRAPLLRLAARPPGTPRPSAVGPMLMAGRPGRARAKASSSVTSSPR